MSIDKWLSAYLKENAQENWIEFLKCASPELTSTAFASHETTNDSFDTILFLKGSISKFLSGPLDDKEQIALYTNANKCMRQYELKKRLVDQYRFKINWKSVSKIEIDKKGYEWFCIFLLAAYEHFNDIRFLNTCCKVLDKIDCDLNLRKNTCSKITGVYAVK